MDTSAFIKALTETLFISVGQATILVLFFKVMFKAVPDIPSGIKFKLWYASLVLIFMLFVLTLATLYLNKSSAAIIIHNNNTIAESATVTLTDRLIIWEERYAGIIALLYFAGVLIHMLLLFIAWLNIRKFRNNETILNDPEWQARLTTLRIRAGVLKEISLHLSNRVTIPLTSGYLKPLILLPVAMLNNLTMQQVEAILLHELAHIKRNDYLLNLFERIMETVLFFNPVIRILSKEIQKEREYCCDEMVVANNADPLIYANALLMLEEHRYQNQLILAANGNNKYPLLTRIQKFTTMEKLTSSPKTRLLALVAIFSIGISLAWVIPGAQKDNSDINVISEPVSKDDHKVVHLSQEKTDTIKKTLKSPQKAKKRGLQTTDQSKDVHADPQVKVLEKELQETSAQIQQLVDQQTKILDSEEWKQNQKNILKNTEEIRKHFNSPQWKEIQKEMTITSEEMAKHFNSPEWKKFQKELHINASNLAKNPKNPEFKKKQEELKNDIELYHKKFENEDWIKKQEEIERKTQEFNKVLESPEWKKQQREIELKTEELTRKFEASPEWKNKLKDLEWKMEELHKKLEELKKKE